MQIYDFSHHPRLSEHANIQAAFPLRQYAIWISHVNNLCVIRVSHRMCVAMVSWVFWYTAKPATFEKRIKKNHSTAMPKISYSLLPLGIFRHFSNIYLLLLSMMMIIKWVMAYLYCSHKKKHQIHNQILGTSSSTLFWSTLQGQQQALCVQRQREKEMSMCRGQVYKWPSMICIASSPRKVEYFFNLKQQQTQTMKKIKLTNPN